MSVVDCHVHLYPAEVNRGPAAWAKSQGEDPWAVLCTRLRKNGKPVQHFPDVTGLLEAMDGAGVERAILQGWYWAKHDTCRWQNRFYDDCVRAHPDRLSAFASLQPTAGEQAIREEIRWAAESGFIGLGELSPHSQGVSFLDPGWQEILVSAAEWRLPVTLHVSEPAGKAYPGRVLTPLEDFVLLAQEHPAVTFILAHWGGRLPSHARWGTALKLLHNVFYDTAASPLLYEPEVFPEMLAAAGPERVLFGSDYPLVLYPSRELAPSMDTFIGEVRTLGLTALHEEAVLGGNARRLFSLG